MSGANTTLALAASQLLTTLISSATNQSTLNSTSLFAGNFSNLGDLSHGATPAHLNNSSAFASKLQSANANIQLHFGDLPPQYGAHSLLLKNHKHQDQETDFESRMISKTSEGYYVFDNITLKVSFADTYLRKLLCELCDPAQNNYFLAKLNIVINIFTFSPAEMCSSLRASTGAC